MVGPYDSPQEWIGNVFYEPPGVGRHRSWCPPGSIEKSGITGYIHEIGDEWISPYEAIASAAAR
jgi:hypothetical protein